MHRRPFEGQHLVSFADITFLLLLLVYISFCWHSFFFVVCRWVFEFLDQAVLPLPPQLRLLHRWAAMLSSTHSNDWLDMDALQNCNWQHGTVTDSYSAECWQLQCWVLAVTVLSAGSYSAECWQLQCCADSYSAECWQLQCWVLTVTVLSADSYSAEFWQLQCWVLTVTVLSSDSYSAECWQLQCWVLTVTVLSADSYVVSYLKFLLLLLNKLSFSDTTVIEGGRERKHIWDLSLLFWETRYNS